MGIIPWLRLYFCEYHNHGMHRKLFWKQGMNSELSLDDTAGCRQEVCAQRSSTSAWNHSIVTLDPNISMSSFTWNISASSASGDKLLSTETRTSLIVLYTFTILFSVIGNILVVIVFSKGGRSRTDIRPFLISLAVADLIMAIFCMPFTFTYVMTRTWIFSKPMCPIVLFMQHLSVSASVFTNMAIGIDRFLVVTFPLRARMTAKRARYTIGVIWVCAMCLSAVQLVISRAKNYHNIVHCDEQWTSPSERRTFTMFVLFITYVIPLVILAVTYSIVSILLWKRTTPGNAHEGRDLQQLKGKRKVIKMLVIVVIMFGVCWLPLHTFFLVLDFNPGLSVNASKADQHLFTIIYCAAFWLAMFNSCANPIIYGFTNDSFRHDLASLCYLGFPFCVCLRHVANRRLSVSTFDSVNCKRFPNRKSLGASANRQGGYRNGCRVYLELKKDSFRERRNANVNEFFNPNSEPDTPDSSLNRNTHFQNHSNGHDNNSELGHNNHHHHHHHHHRLSPCYKTESEDSTVALTSPTVNGCEKTSSLPSAGRKISSSPTSAGPFGIFRTRSEDRNCSGRLTNYHPVARSEEL